MSAGALLVGMIALGGLLAIYLLYIRKHEGDISTLNAGAGTVPNINAGGVLAFPNGVQIESTGSKSSPGLVITGGPVTFQSEVTFSEDVTAKKDVNVGNMLGVGNNLQFTPAVQANNSIQWIYPPGSQYGSGTTEITFMYNTGNAFLTLADDSNDHKWMFDAEVTVQGEKVPRALI